MSCEIIDVIRARVESLGVLAPDHRLYSCHYLRDVPFPGTGELRLDPRRTIVHYLLVGRSPTDGWWFWTKLEETAYRCMGVPYPWKECIMSCLPILTAFADCHLIPYLFIPSQTGKVIINQPQMAPVRRRHNGQAGHINILPPCASY